jgi:hypothetical protein
MSTDDITHYEVGCICGLGKAQVTSSIPDHAYAKQSQTTYLFDWNCQRCEKIYDILQNGDVYSKSDLLAKSSAETAYTKSINKIRSMHEYHDATDKLAILLDNLPSNAERYRQLSSKKLVSHGSATFNKNWRGGKDWVEQNFVPSDLQKLNVVDPILRAALDQSQNLRSAIPRIGRVKNILN